GMGPQVQPCAPGCNHDASQVPSCKKCSQPQSVQLLVVVSRAAASESPLLAAKPLSVPNLPWWVSGGDNRRILPVFKTGEHPEQVLPAKLKKYNAAFWSDTPAELATTVLSAAGLTPESHRIFISY